VFGADEGPVWLPLLCVQIRYSSGPRADWISWPAPLILAVGYDWMFGDDALANGVAVKLPGCR